MSPLMVEVKSEVLGLLCDIWDAAKERRVQELRTDAAVVAFADGVVDGFAGAAEEERDAMLSAPGREFIRDELRAIVAAHLLGSSTDLSADFVENAHHIRGVERTSDSKREEFARVLVDHYQQPDSRDGRRMAPADMSTRIAPRSGPG